MAQCQAAGRRAGRPNRAGLVEDPAVKGSVVDQDKALPEECSEARILFTERGRVRDCGCIELMYSGRRYGDWTLRANERVEKHLAMCREQGDLQHLGLGV